MRMLYFIGLMLLSALGYAASSDELVAPLVALTDLLSGAVGATLTTLAVVGSGFMFYLGRWDVMRLVATAVGSGLIFGGANLAKMLMGQ
jgi:type IV secretory pathway VirB2 component (pilin)